MRKIIIRGSLVLLAVLLVTAVAIHGSHSTSAAAKKTPSPELQQAASPPNQNAPVIHFVKDPEMAPAFQTVDLAGKPISDAALNGKVILVNFWATWCPPCREEIPEMIALQNQFKDKLEVIGLSEDDDSPALVQKFAKARGINYPIAMVTGDLVKDFGGVAALPTTFIIDTQGRIVQKHTGFHPIQEYQLEIQYLLGMRVNARVETFVDQGQIFLKNAANATELPGVSFEGLTPEQKKLALHRMNAESCTCGCMQTISQCRISDSTCETSMKLATEIVKEVAGGKPAAATPAKAAPSAKQ